LISFLLLLLLIGASVELQASGTKRGQEGYHKNRDYVIACMCLVYVALAGSGVETGTGFLIAVPLGAGALVWFRYMITNNHVIPDIDTARKTLLDFRNERNGSVTQCKVQLSRRSALSVPFA
jgi:hypothetical protein